MGFLPNRIIGEIAEKKERLVASGVWGRVIVVFGRLKVHISLQLQVEVGSLVFHFFTTFLVRGKQLL